MDISNRIKEAVGHIQSARNTAGFTQADVAKRLGKKQSAISTWESGEHLPSLKDIIIMCELYSVTPNKLLEGDDDVSAPPPATPSMTGPCIISSSGIILKITPEEENYLMACLLEARDGRQNSAVLEPRGKKETTA